MERATVFLTEIVIFDVSILRSFDTSKFRYFEVSILMFRNLEANCKSCSRDGLAVQRGH